LGRRKRRQKKKARRKHQRIYIRRSIRSGRLKGIVGGLEGSSFYESLSLLIIENNDRIKKEPRKDRPSRGVLVIQHQLLLANEYTSFIILVTREEVH
jgi:hypothetical protein